MLYSEAAYFDGAHVQHIADYQEHQRIERIHKTARKSVELAQRERRTGGRARLALVHG